MDYAEASKTLESEGYKKTLNATEAFTHFKTTFTKEGKVIIINWSMGGYISEISCTYKSSAEFFETFLN